MHAPKPFDYEVHYTFPTKETMYAFGNENHYKSQIFRNVSKQLVSEDVYLVTVKTNGIWEMIADRFLDDNNIPPGCIRRKIETVYYNTDMDTPEPLYLECHIVSPDTFIFNTPPMNWHVGRSFSAGKNYLTFRVMSDKIPNIKYRVFEECRKLASFPGLIFHEEMCIYDDNIELDRNWL